MPDLSYWSGGDDDRIDKRFPRGHCPVVCKNHPKLSWSTKNLGYIGARNLFFNGRVGDSESKTGLGNPIIRIADQFELIDKETVVVDMAGFPKAGAEPKIYTYQDWRRDLQRAIDSYVQGINAGYVFECACPLSDLRIMTDDEYRAAFDKEPVECEP